MVSMVEKAGHWIQDKLIGRSVLLLLSLLEFSGQGIQLQTELNQVNMPCSIFPTQHKIKIRLQTFDLKAIKSYYLSKYTYNVAFCIKLCLSEEIDMLNIYNIMEQYL